MCIATGQRNYVSLIFWRRDGVGLLSRKSFSTIKAQSSSLSRHLPKVSPPPQPRPPQMAAKTWWSPPVSCDFNSSNSKCSTSQTYKYRDGAFIFFIKRLDLFCRNSSSFCKVVTFLRSSRRRCCPPWTTWLWGSRAPAHTASPCCNILKTWCTSA